MSDSSDLEGFLQQAGRSGAFESSSGFRVDAASAMSRLSGFRLPSPFHWAAKLVQWSNTVGAESISFTLRRTRTEVMVVCEAPLSAEQVLRDMTKVTTLSDHLVTALLGLAREETCTFELEIKNLESHDAFSYVFDEKTISLADNRLLKQHGLRLSVHGRGGWKSDRRALRKFLHKLCWSSPVPVRVNNRELETRFVEQHPKNSFKTLYGLRFGLAWAALPALAGRPPLKIRPPSLEGFERLKRRDFGQGYARSNVPERGMFLVYQSEGAWGACLNIKTQTRSAVVFCCDGVEVDRHVIEEPIVDFGTPELWIKVGCEIFVEVGPQETDLSGFQVRERESLAAQALAACTPHMLRLWDLFLTCPIAFSSKLFTRKQQRVTDMSVALSTGATLAIAAGVSGGGVLAGMAIGVPVAMVSGKGVDLLSWYLKFLIRYSFGSAFRMTGFRESLLEIGALQAIPGWEFLRPEDRTLAQGWSEWSTAETSALNWACDLLLSIREMAPTRNVVEYSFSKGEIRVSSDLESPAYDTVPQALLSLPSLRRALTDLAQLQPSQISLQIGDNKALWTESSYQLLESDMGPRFILQASFPRSGGQGGFLKALKARFRAETEPFAETICALHEYGWLSPVSVDKVTLPSRANRFPRDRRQVCYDVASTNLPLCLGRRDLPPMEGEPWLECPAESPPEKVLALSEGWVCDQKLKLPGTFLFWGRQQQRQRGVILINSFQRSNSAVEFVCRGVIVDAIPLYPSELFRKGGGIMTHVKSLTAIVKLLNWPVCVRCLVPVDAPPSGPERARLAHQFLSQHRLEILELADEILLHLPKLSYRWTAEMFKSREASVQQFNLHSTSHKFPARRRKKVAQALHHLPSFLDDVSSRLPPTQSSVPSPPRLE